MHLGRAWECISSKFPGGASQADTLISQATGSHSIPKLEVISPAPRLSHFAHVTHGDSYHITPRGYDADTISVLSPATPGTPLMRREPQMNS